MANYVGINGVSRPISGGYVGVNGIAKKLVKGYVGVNEVAKSIWSDEIPDPIDFIEGNYTTYENDLVTEIKQGAFVDNQNPPSTFFANLRQLSFPNVKYVGDYSLSGLSASVYLPNLETIGNYAFGGYGILDSDYRIDIDWSKVKTIGSSAFSMTTVGIPNVFENLEEIGSEAFYSGQYNRGSKDSLTFYKLRSIYRNSFEHNDKYTLYVKTLSILSDSVCVVYGDESFGPFDFFEDSRIIVPASLVDAYKSDTFWSTYANLIEGV